MPNAQRFKHTDVPKQPGELARLKIVQGPDYGAIYVLTGTPALIGRGEECDIQISDLKASRVHAELTAIIGGWNIKDRGSANGILYNGKATRETKLKLNDVIVLGETTLEFTSAEAGTMMLTAPPRSIDKIQAEQRQLEDHRNKLRSMGLSSLFGKTDSGNFSADLLGGQPPKKKSPLLLIVGALAAILFMLPDGGNKKSPMKKKSTDADTLHDLAAFLPSSSDPNRAADTFFKDGFREYLAGNFNRARTQFETVLQVSPGHPLATLYLENCVHAINTEVAFHMEYGKKAVDAGKLREARGHYARILRLLYKDQSNENFIRAKESFDKVQQTIRGVNDKPAPESTDQGTGTAAMNRTGS